jgi:hypothetical protein
MMRTYKAVIAAVATGLTCLAVTSQASFTPVSPGTLASIFGGSDFNTPGSGLVNTWLSNYSFGSNSGTLTTDVYNVAGLPLGGQVFIYTLIIKTGSATGLTVGGFTGNVYVNNVAGTASDAVSANYNTLGGITFSWSSAQTRTNKVVVDTSSTGWTTGIATIANSTPSLSGFGNASSLAPAVPEPSTIVAGVLMLLPFGIGAIHTLRKARRG